MIISSIRAIPVHVERDIGQARGMAGSPNELSGRGAYRWSRDYPVLYSTRIETALVKVRLSDGTVGWGEAQAPLAPEVACAIVDRLLAPAIVGEAFDGSVGRIGELWQRMYSTMRVRGQTGGFMLDAISGVDLALWDLAGKLAGKPVSRLIREDARGEVPAYLSGLAGPGIEERLRFAEPYLAAGFEMIKLYYESDWPALLALMDRLPARVAVDALWHLDPGRAVEMARELDARSAVWLECPLMPEEIEGHRDLAAAIRTPLAIGESYRTCHELEPFFKGRMMRYVQPDLGRSGITESLRIAARAAELGMEVVPHVSIAFGPQIAAAMHLGAALDNCPLCEFNPLVLKTANRFLETPLEMRGRSYLIPDAPGLGTALNETELEAASSSVQ